MAAVDYLLQETSVGYGLYQVVQQPDTIGNRLKEVQEATQDLSRFGKMIKLVSFAPFQGAAQALENANDISEGIANDHLKALLELNLPKGRKKKKAVLGISDKNLAGSIKATFPGVDCETNEVVQDLLRGLRLWGPKLLKQLQDGDMDRAQLGLGHAYSRAKVKFSVQKNDNHIIQSIALLDTLDKDINTFAMRVREWYSWHFPELVKIVNENYLYARLILFIRDKKTLSNDRLHELVAITNDDAEIAQSIIDAAKVSMGQDISDMDIDNICNFAEKIVGARLISHAGSLTNLSKYPASTVQILGAEKALFRALKTKGNTPKYGLIYHSSFIGRAGAKNKGRISRFLANKCSIASRIDSFSDSPTTKFGEALRKQVEERLDFYANGTAPQKNQDAMKDAMDAVLADIAVDADEDDGQVDLEMADIVKPKKSKDKKKEKSKENREEKSDKRQGKEQKEQKDKKGKKGKRDKKDKKDKKDIESKKRRRDEEEDQDVSERKKSKKEKREKKEKKSKA
ncbi:unnamed protein product [Tuber melanosporum]|uniref:Nucleolar protein 56 n=1 Tax=Tuber melanosporum (strain Mel28) TaxID=656061 RepID=D5G9I0_TUBMM|nr:uncharacterized protein GSTUM_00003410001 [Tuber melanosporum]CAZ81173.1 unnamed protein product [Tuber melanosporum]